MAPPKVTPENLQQFTEDASLLLAERLGEVPAIAVVLGSGWDVLAERREPVAFVDFEDVPGFGPTSSEGHSGRISVVGTEGGPVLLQCGRLHCYEGLSALQVAFPVLAYGAAGVRLVVLLSAVGGLNPSFIPGDLMQVTDHMALWCDDPLEGLAAEGLGSPHISLVGLYSKNVGRLLKGCLPAGARCESGVYAYVRGPTYETPAEASLLRVLGADAVGMSMVPEAIAAGYAGIDVGALACVSNTLLPSHEKDLSHGSVLEVVRRTARGLDEFLDELVKGWNVIV